MKNMRAATAMVILLFVLIGCNFSTANLSDLTTSKDKAGKEKSSGFKSGDTLFGTTTVSNNPGKVKVNFYLTAENSEGAKKGEVLKGSEVSVNLDGDGVASYSVPVSAAFPPGTYKLTADMINEAGEKKDSKTVEVKVEKSADSEKPATDESQSEETTDDDADSDN